MSAIQTTYQLYNTAEQKGKIEMNQLFSGIIGMALTFSLQSFANPGQSQPLQNTVADQSAAYAQDLCPQGFSENDLITIWNDGDQQWYEGRISGCLQENGSPVLIINYTADDGQEYELSTTVEPAEEETTAEN
jgi:hypothetical protein